LAFYPYSFEGTVAIYDVGSDRYVYTVIWLPNDVAALLPLKQYPKLRIFGEANEIEFKAALMPVRGRRYILFSAKALKAMGVGVGDDVNVVFDIDDQDAVDMPEALSKALDADAEIAALWSQQTAGKRRGLAFRVLSAKSVDTQGKRIAEVFDILTGRRDARGKLIEPAS